jgi:hypothetical protein
MPCRLSLIVDLKDAVSSRKEVAYVFDAAAVLRIALRRNGPAPSRIKDRIADLSANFADFSRRHKVLCGISAAMRQRAAALKPPPAY